MSLSRLLFSTTVTHANSNSFFLNADHHRRGPCARRPRINCKMWSCSILLGNYSSDRLYLLLNLRPQPFGQHFSSKTFKEVRVPSKMWEDMPHWIYIFSRRFFLRRYCCFSNICSYVRLFVSLTRILVHKTKR